MAALKPESDDWHKACEIVQHDLNTFVRNVAQLSDWIALDLSEADIKIPHAVEENVIHLKDLADQMSVFSGDLVRLLLSGTRGDGTSRIDWVIDAVVDDHFPDWNDAIVQDIRARAAPLAEPDASALLYALLSRISARNLGVRPQLHLSTYEIDGQFVIEITEVLQRDTPGAQADRWAEFESKTTNLAIATAKKICEVHHGQMHFRVDPKTGDRVMRVQFPV